MPKDINQPEILTSTVTELEAKMILDVLADEGIDGQVEAKMTIASHIESPGKVQIIVCQNDLDCAKQILDQFRQLQSDVDWADTDSDDDFDLY